MSSQRTQRKLYQHPGTTAKNEQKFKEWVLFSFLLNKPYFRITLDLQKNSEDRTEGRLAKAQILILRVTINQTLDFFGLPQLFTDVSSRILPCTSQCLLVVKENLTGTVGVYFQCLPNPIPFLPPGGSWDESCCPWFHRFICRKHTQYYLGPLCVCVCSDPKHPFCKLPSHWTYCLSLCQYIFKKSFIPFWFITNGEVNLLQIYFSSPLTVGDVVLLQTTCDTYSGTGGSVS